MAAIAVYGECDFLAYSEYLRTHPPGAAVSLTSAAAPLPLELDSGMGTARGVFTSLASSCTINSSLPPQEAQREAPLWALDLRRFRVRTPANGRWYGRSEWAALSLSDRGLHSLFRRTQVPPWPSCEFRALRVLRIGGTEQCLIVAAGRPIVRGVFLGAGWSGLGITDPFQSGPSRTS